MKNGILFSTFLLSTLTNIASAQIDINNPNCFNDKVCIQECLKDKQCNDRFIYESRKDTGKMLYDSAIQKIQNNQHAEGFNNLKNLADSDLNYWIRTIAQYQVASMYKNGKGTTKDIDLSIKYFELSIANGKNDPLFLYSPYFKDAYFQLSILYAMESQSKNISLSNKNLLAAARENCLFAQNNLANSLFNGNGMKKNKKLSLALRFYEINDKNNARSWKFIEENYSIDAKNNLETFAHDDINKIVGTMTKSEVEEAKKLSMNEDQLFKLIEKSINQ